MKFGVLGTGMVGTTLASRLVALGHEVMMGAREAANVKAGEWAAKAGKGASSSTFADAAAFGEILFSCTLGAASVEALRMSRKENLRGKILIDVSNPLDFSKGMPPTLLTGGEGDSLGEQIQREFPEARVVKALNTVAAAVMAEPERAGGESDLFLCGNDAEAKSRVTELLREFGWTRIHDLGDISGARGTEAYLLLWLRLFVTGKTPDFNVRVVRK